MKETAAEVSFCTLCIYDAAYKALPEGWTVYQNQVPYMTMDSFLHIYMSSPLEKLSKKINTMFLEARREEMCKMQR